MNTTDIKFEHPQTPVEWDLIFFAMADSMALRSKDPSTRCGAVIVNRDNRIIGTGFNGPPSDIVDTSVPWEKRPQKYAFILHAEENALWEAIESRGLREVSESTVYCTHAPCTECVLRMIRSRIKCVKVPRNSPNYPLSKYQVDPESLLETQKYPKLDIKFV